MAHQADLAALAENHYERSKSSSSSNHSLTQSCCRYRFYPTATAIQKAPVIHYVKAEEIKCNEAASRLFIPEARSERGLVSW